MNCWFCPRDGVASAEAPNSAASTIPTRFPFIGCSIDTRKRLGAARGSRMSPLGWRKFSDLQQLGCDLPRQSTAVTEWAETYQWMLKSSDRVSRENELHSLRLRPPLRLRSCISALASRKSAVSKPSVNCL